jgi:hypothetical protein
MSSKDSITTLASEIAASVNLVLFHKNRFATLAKRVETVVEIIKGDIDNSKNTVVTQAMDFLVGTLEDIKENMMLFSEKNALLANRIIIYGTDEEQFIKWGERIQHCVDTIGKSAKLAGVFDEKIDLMDFKRDAEDLKKSLLEILVLVGGKNVDLKQLSKTLESLVGHQTDVRSTYQTKTSPTAALEMDPRKVKYDKIIGRGGIFWYNC